MKTKLNSSPPCKEKGKVVEGSTNSKQQCSLKWLTHSEAGNLSIKQNKISAMSSIVEHKYSDTLPMLAKLFWFETWNL